jgi:hypothetical protein
MLLLTGAGAAAALAILAAGSLWRVLARRDHRCVVVSRPSACGECQAVLRGAARGGHVVCACGAASPHLHGTALLAWRSQHQGETFPGTPTAAAEPAPQDEAGDALAAVEAEDEALRRAVHRARRNPDPRSPQVLREAERELGRADVNES